jgi:hypothetical protein
LSEDAAGDGGTRCLGRDAFIAWGCQSNLLLTVAGIEPPENPNSCKSRGDGRLLYPLAPCRAFAAVRVASVAAAPAVVAGTGDADGTVAVSLSEVLLSYTVPYVMLTRGLLGGFQGDRYWVVVVLDVVAAAGTAGTAGEANGDDTSL